METAKLEKNLSEIFERKYIVPLYQRNFAWAEEEISSLLLDVYDSYRKSINNNYFIGSLVVLPRKNGDFEIIDGQQRLTTITLIAKILDFMWMKESKLFYDSRPEVESFFASFYRTGDTNDVTFGHDVSHLIHAVDIIKDTIINPDESDPKTLLRIDDLECFKKYFAEKVILVRVEIPDDTDVANYFEIMNNRGEQLHKHEILKARLIDTIKIEGNIHDKNRQSVFASIWNACSQMDIQIQKLFIKNHRLRYFGEEYNRFVKSDFFDESISDDNSNGKPTIDGILRDSLKNLKTNTKVFSEFDDIDDESDNKSIIDFPNFLMHIFKLKYNEIYKNKSKSGGDIPLNENNLLEVFDTLSEDINAMDFVFDLLFYRTIFDRFIIKASTTEDAEDGYKWSLEMPYKTEQNSLKYRNSFEDSAAQERLIKSLSMLQVTFRNRKYKNWLQTVLSWFGTSKDILIEPTVFQEKLDKLNLDYYKVNFKVLTVELPYTKGTNTPHFLFNFIDYLYWVDSKRNSKKGIFDFDFKYRNSVEHHLPQSFANEENKDWIHNLGNLCLISKGSNSKMNNEEPKGKASRDGKYFRNNLPPKQKTMYDLTNQNNRWSNDEIRSHYKDIIDLLDQKDLILSTPN